VVRGWRVVGETRGVLLLRHALQLHACTCMHARCMHHARCIHLHAFQHATTSCCNHHLCCCKVFPSLPHPHPPATQRTASRASSHSRCLAGAQADRSSMNSCRSSSARAYPVSTRTGRDGDTRDPGAGCDWVRGVCGVRARGWQGVVASVGATRRDGGGRRGVADVGIGSKRGCKSRP